MYKITQQKKMELEERLHFLETTEKDRVLKFLHDNPIAESFHQAASIEAHRNAYEKELNEVRMILKQSEIIDESLVDKTRVSVGCFVEVIIDEEVSRFHIVSSIEANPKDGKISLESPLGFVIKDKKVGDIINWSSERVIKIQSIS